MNRKNSLYLIGIINIVEGILGLLYGKIFIRGWKEVSSIEIFIWLLSGVVFIIIAKDIKAKQIKYTICPNCKQTYNYKDLKDGKCPTCKDVDTIDIEHYYTDNPFKEDDKDKDKD